MKILRWLKNEWLRFRLYLLNPKYGKTLINWLDSKAVVLYPGKKNVYDNFKHGMSWGYLHPEYSHNAMAYEKMGIWEINKQLLLGNESFNGKLIHEGIEYRPKVVSGCIHGRQLYKYGQFEIDCQVPRNGMTWPAFWLYGTTWPPEIDVFEYMPDSDKMFRKKLGAGIYYGDSKDKQESGFRARVGRPDDTIVVALDWTPKYLKWYYNGVLFKEITDPEIMKHFQTGMYLVAGTGVRDDYDERVFDEYLKINSIIYKPI